jgi:hypothetical protein
MNALFAKSGSSLTKLISANFCVSLQSMNVRNIGTAKM